MPMQTIIAKKPRPVFSFFRLLCRSLAEGYELMRQRQALATLTDSQLRDIGLTRSDVAGEVRKSFWCN